MIEGQEAFLKDFEGLVRKHQISIGGCGCCGSPWLYSLERRRFDPAHKTDEELIEERIKADMKHLREG